MTPHAKIYFKHFGYQIPEDVFCEQCNDPAVDIHHINGRGTGKDVIENLMALCRHCHDSAHNSPNQYISKLVFQSIHNEFLKDHVRS